LHSVYLHLAKAEKLQFWPKNTQVAGNHRNGAIETQKFSQLSISWPSNPVQ